MTKEETTLKSLIKFELAPDFSVSLEIGSLTVLVVLLLLVLCLFVWLFKQRIQFESLEFDAAEFGFGSSKVQFKPNALDRQIAYGIWVELSTRKIGLEIDLEHDVISEVYDSWYQFFGVTRELIKAVPAHKLKQQGTRAIVKTSVHVLNDGLRPHLTKWQSRFRRWLERQKDIEDEPQVLQTQFPRFDELSEDLLMINAQLIAYRKKIYELATGDKEAVIDIENEK